jgi:hypothetical protein
MFHYVTVPVLDVITPYTKCIESDLDSSSLHLKCLNPPPIKHSAFSPSSDKYDASVKSLPLVGLTGCLLLLPLNTKKITVDGCIACSSLISLLLWAAPCVKLEP